MGARELLRKRRAQRVNAARVLILNALVVADGPLSSYELRCRIPMRLLWICRGLDALLADGFIVDSWQAVEPGKPARRFYFFPET